MRIKNMTDFEVEQEIERLKNSEYVRLAKKETRLRNKQRQYMYSLRNYEKRGKQLAASGFTIENIERLIDTCRDEIE